MQKNEDKSKFTLENDENDNILITKRTKLKRSIGTTILISKFRYCHERDENNGF
jgi:hypothetical protein